MASRTVSTQAEALILRNQLRKSWIVQNEDTTDAVYLKKETGTALTVSATDHDHRIGPGGSLALNSLTDGEEAIQERWTVIASANTPRVSYFETETIRR